MTVFLSRRTGATKVKLIALEERVLILGATQASPCLEFYWSPKAEDIAEWNVPPLLWAGQSVPRNGSLDTQTNTPSQGTGYKGERKMSNKNSLSVGRHAEPGAPHLQSGERGSSETVRRLCCPLEFREHIADSEPPQIWGHLMGLSAQLQRKKKPLYEKPALLWKASGKMLFPGPKGGCWSQMAGGIGMERLRDGCVQLIISSLNRKRWTL